ncbi:MAG: tRNA (adenosine(37)-N6)-threonylcarbamoyltransferase complex ATPase subunit type 1 TsaE [Alphaproteobacteria bacterium]|nr:MAG: tRNA (adenosine(37)-N6)-threonylcarbamoyltransferase complex ATPase subunit type 1 TsaE [Alphaproteobacteria bacterium]
MVPGAERSDIGITLADERATRALAEALAARLRPGDVLLLEGPVGAGKSVIARAIIQALQAAAGAEVEEVPSPSYTLVQTYRAGPLEIWHADLYRLGDESELDELGIATEAAADAILLVEWPELFLPAAPASALRLRIEPVPGAAEARRLTLNWRGGDWAGRLATLAPESAGSAA